jgi:hypothetical protein
MDHLLNGSLRPLFKLCKLNPYPTKVVTHEIR